jgi:membrane protease YdiL (CAAX protease family)
MVKALAYLFTMWLCALVVDMYILWKPAGRELPVRKPRTEAIYALLFTALGMLGLMLRFNWLNWDTTPGMFRLLIFLLIVLFAFPIALAVLMLFRKYKLADLGFRVHGLIIAIPIIAIVAGMAGLISPESLTLKRVLDESGGILQALIMGFITAGLSEEFMKMMLFTRLGAWWNNRAFAWLVAAIIWGFMHAPKWYSETLDLIEVILSSIRIIPIGLMWSYITYRTKNVLPATLVHGSNVWGFQNF